MNYNPFWKTLDETRRERVFALMRAWDTEAVRYFDRGRETPGTIPVGGAFFDEVLKGAVHMEFVSALRTAPSVEEAHKTAANAVRLWVKKHNERRPNDVHWRRWTESGQDDLERLVRQARLVAE